MNGTVTELEFATERAEVLQSQNAQLVSELAHTRVLLKRALAQLEGGDNGDSE